jgi:hypothetical protein
MRSKFIISSLVAFIAAVGLMAAPAFADYSLAGYTSATFGSRTTDNGVDDADSRLEALGRTELNVGFSDGALSGKFRLRFENANANGVTLETDDDGNVTDVTTAAAPSTMRHQVTWKATDTVAVTVAPSHFGFAGAGTNANADYFRANTAADAVDGQFAQYSVPVFAVDVNLGGLNVGFGIVAVCGSRTGSVGSNGGLCQSGGNLKSDDQTIVLHVSGRAGTVKYNGAYASGSGTTNDDAEESVSGSALQAGAKVDLGGMAVGFDYGSATAAGIGDGDDITESFLGLAFFLSDSLGVDYHSKSADNGTVVQTRTEIDAHYKIKGGEKSYYGVEFRNRTDGSDADGAVDKTDQLIAFGIRVNF